MGSCIASQQVQNEPESKESRLEIVTKGQNEQQKLQELGSTFATPTTSDSWNPLFIALSWNLNGASQNNHVNYKYKKLIPRIFASTPIIVVLQECGTPPWWTSTGTGVWNFTTLENTQMSVKWTQQYEVDWTTKGAHGKSYFGEIENVNSGSTPIKYKVQFWTNELSDYQGKMMCWVHSGVAATIDVSNPPTWFYPSTTERPLIGYPTIIKINGIQNIYPICTHAPSGDHNKAAKFELEMMNHITSKNINFINFGDYNCLPSTLTGMTFDPNKIIKTGLPTHPPNELDFACANFNFGTARANWDEVNFLYPDKRLVSDHFGVIFEFK